jgi:hypothetical protein
MSQIIPTFRRSHKEEQHVAQHLNGTGDDGNRVEELLVIVAIHLK